MMMDDPIMPWPELRRQKRAAAAKPALLHLILVNPTSTFPPRLQGREETTP
jgi:hypothetical protein